MTLPTWAKLPQKKKLSAKERYNLIRTELMNLEKKAGTDSDSGKD